MQFLILSFPMPAHLSAVIPSFPIPSLMKTSISRGSWATCPSRYNLTDNQATLDQRNMMVDAGETKGRKCRRKKLLRGCIHGEENGLMTIAMRFDISCVILVWAVSSLFDWSIDWLFVSRYLGAGLVLKFWIVDVVMWSCRKGCVCKGIMKMWVGYATSVPWSLEGYRQAQKD